MKELVDAIYRGSEEQSLGLIQVNRAIVQIEQVTQATAATAEESAAASEQLNAQAESVKEVVTSLYRMVGGAKTSSAAGISGLSKLRLPVKLTAGTFLPTKLANKPVPTVSDSSFMSF